MGTRVSADDVRHIAALARLTLEDGRVVKLQQELNAILDHMDALAQVDTGTVHTFTSRALDAMPLRSDGESSSVRLALPLAELAPEMRDGFFLVPRLATHDDADA